MTRTSRSIRGDQQHIVRLQEPLPLVHPQVEEPVGQELDAFLPEGSQGGRLSQAARILEDNRKLRLLLARLIHDLGYVHEDDLMKL